MQLVADGGYLITGLAIHAVTHPLQVPLWIDLTSVVVAALAGAAVAVEERLDFIGGILLGVIMGLGGGIIRDLLLGLRPVAVSNHYYLPTVTVAALAGYLFASLLRRVGPPFVVLDAMATGLFTVVGVEKALLYDLPYVSAIFIGVAASVGGGLFVDLIAGRPVGMVNRGPWNATAALAGAVCYAVLADFDAPTGFRQAAAFAVVVAMRLASLRWGLQTPLPDELVRKLTSRRQQGDDDAPQDTARDTPPTRPGRRSTTTGARPNQLRRRTPAPDFLADATTPWGRRLLRERSSPMGETRGKFDKDFREGAVRLVRETGKPIAQVAKDLGINEGTLGNWVNADRRRRGEGDGALSEDERAELVRLRRENAELAMRCDVLKRSVALWVSDAMGR